MLADSRSAPPLFRFALEIVLLCLVAVVCGCASASRFAIVPRLESAQQKRSAMASIEKTHRVTVEPLGKIFSKAIDELPAFEVSLENRGPGELFFLPEHVSVFSGERSVRAYTRSELAVRIEREVEREAEEYTGQQAEVFLQSGVTRQDPSAALATITAAKRTNQAAARRESWDKRRRAVGRLIAPVRIAAGQADRAVLMLHGEDVLPNETLRIVIAIDSESYEFIFDVSPI